MTTTLEELKHHLSRESEVDLLELLNITSEQIVERFTDEIENRFPVLESEFGLQEDIFSNEEDPN